MLNKFLTIIGVLTFAVGLLWIGQGLGYIQWPANSFMINQVSWAYYGGFLALGGILIILFTRR